MLNSKNPYTFFNTYCLRTPLLPLNRVLNAIKKRDIEDEYLKEYWQKNHLKEAVFLASPYLFSELELLFEGKITSVKKAEKLKQSFLKYVLRASSRCTPFGLFSGISVGGFNKNSRIEIKAVEQHKRITKYDTNYIASLLNHVSENTFIKNQSLFFPNTTLYKVANQYRYIEYQLDNGKRTYSLEGVVHSSYLETIFKASEKGKTIHQLINEIKTSDISTEDASGFIQSLIENQILVSEFELNVTGKDSLSIAIEKIDSFKGDHQITSVLKLLQEQLTGIDRKTGNTSIPYKDCFTLIKDLGVAYEEKYVFQTDLFVQTNTNTLAIKHGYTVKKILPLLNKLSPFQPNIKLEHFKKAFLERYETRELPLAQVLDIELGIGYIQNQSISDTTPFLEDILTQKSNHTEETFAWNEIDTILYQKLLDSESNNQHTIELRDSDFEHIESDWSHTPNTLSAFTEVLKTDTEEYLVVNGLSAHAGSLLARFSYGDTKLLEHLKQIVSLEQTMQSEKIIAEIVHLPETRTGNILKRPHLTAYEIPYLSTVPFSQQISINDLWISIKNNTIILRSKKLNKEILPRLTNAHNYALRALPIYHFLCDLQFQNKKRYLGFSWPQLSEKHAYLPRVVYKNTILSKAKWNLKKGVIKTFMVHYSDETSILASIQEWRKRFQVPKYVQLVEHDNTLLIDLESFISLQLLLSTLKNTKQCLLEEFLFTEETIVNREQERFTNECIIALYNNEKLKSKSL